MDERVVMVGAGYWSQFQVEGWRDAGAPLVAICNRSAAPAEALSQRYGVPRVYGDLQVMFDAEKPTLVDVCLPPVAQAAAVRAAIARGLPTICQKPFGKDLPEAQAMTAIAEAAGVPLVVHENFRFTPWFRECKRLINSGFFGRVHGISFRLRPGDGQGPQAYLDRQPTFQQMPEFLVRELPDVPTFAEIGLAGVNRMSLLGVSAPKGTPKATVDKLNAALKSVLAMPKVSERIEATGAIVVGNSADEYQKQVSDELSTYRRVVLGQRLKLE